MISVSATSFSEWRIHARSLLANGIPPENTHWQQPQQDGLFNETQKDPPSFIAPVASHKVSKAFMELAQTAACYRDDQRWALLYRTLWRLTHGEPHLLSIASDDDIHQLNTMAKAVRRDSHKMKAFVRFRKITEPSSGYDCYIAWHQPSHLVVECTAPFFVRRFTTMNWAILTPDSCAYWDQQQLQIGAGLPRTAAPREDEVEDLWKTFYQHIFNPARIKVGMMKSEMPMKFWHTLPEAQLIPDMLNSSSQRVSNMIEAISGSESKERNGRTQNRTTEDSGRYKSER